MESFNKYIAISSSSMAAAVGALGIGAYQDHLYRQERQQCYANLGERIEVKTCSSIYNPSTDNGVKNIYGGIVISLGALSMFISGKAYKERQAQP